MDDWTKERVVLLRKLWAEGMSASAIAAELGGGITKNAIIGKVHRSGFERDGVSARKQTQQKLPKIAMLNPAAPRVPPEKAAASPAPTPIASALGELAEAAVVGIPTTRRVALLDLRDTMCRWPIGDPREAGFGFCGARATGAVYCGYHAQIAYTTAAEAKRAAAEWRQAHSKAARAA